jgi:hypothetical protein
VIILASASRGALTSRASAFSRQQRVQVPSCYEGYCRHAGTKEGKVASLSDFVKYDGDVGGNPDSQRQRRNDYKPRPDLEKLGIIFSVIGKTMQRCRRH